MLSSILITDTTFSVPDNFLILTPWVFLPAILISFTPVLITLPLFVEIRTSSPSFTGKEDEIFDGLPLKYQKKTIIHNLKNLNYDEDRLKISNVKNFKGFESSCVIFTDYNLNHSDELLKNYLYVGMTRSMYILCLLISSTTNSIENV